MDSDTESQHLKQLSEFVYDEDKVVTFKWLSKTLNISVENSKNLLEKYIKTGKRSDLEVIYWVSGKLEDDSCRALLITQYELEDKFNKFTNVSCKFIYSVYKKNETNFKDLLINSETKVDIQGIITNKRCSKRNLKQKAPLPALKKTDITNQKPSLFSKSTKSASNSDVSNKKNEIKTSANNAAKKENGSSKGIASFISKMPEKQKKPQSDNCLSKSDTKQNETESIAEEKNTKEINKNKDNLNIIDSDDSEEEKRVPKDIINKIPKAKKSRNKRKRDTDNSSGKNKKQRRRIVEPNDSDSDDIFANDDQEEHQEPTHVSDEEEELVFKPKPDLGPKNKRRKLINQTYTDEDGYLMTRKEWVTVDDESEDEKENEVKEVKTESKDNKASKVNDIREAKSKNVASSNGLSKPKGNKSKKPVANQTTLMKFFTKS